MRILRLVHSVDPAKGGVSTWVNSSTSALKNLGHQVDILSLDNPDAPYVLESPNRIICMEHTLGNYGYATKLISFLKKNTQYDCILVEGLWQYITWATYKAFLTTKIPYFVVTHGMLDPWFNKKYPLKYIKKYLYWVLFEHKVLKNARKVLFTSLQECNLAQNSFYPYAINAAIMPLGIEPPISPTKAQETSFLQEHPILRNKRIFLYLGRINPKKGLDLLIQAWHVLKKEKDSDQAFLVIAGPSEDIAYKKKLLQISKSLRVENSILWLGMQEGLPKWILYALAECFVLPSHQENFGLTLAESMAAGTPVLTTKKVNIWEIITKNNAGLIGVDTQESIEELLKKWWNLPTSKIQDFRYNSQQCFLKHFSLSQSVATLLEILQKT